ncbi:hypothetical protein LSAT2_017015 [Lamellibrachia satsuma]|nr:hypothetical protein LSAT2_017015 [Lamellibrachia satsuma]
MSELQETTQENKTPPVSDAAAPDATVNVLPVCTNGVGPDVTVDLVDTIDVDADSVKLEDKTESGNLDMVLVMKETKKTVSACAFSVTSTDIWVSKSSLFKNSIRMGVLHAISYPVITFAFLLGSNLEQMPEPPLHLFDNVLDWSQRASQRWFVAISILMWVSHFMRRFLEVMFLYTSRKAVTYVNAFVSLTIRTFFCFCVGWSLNYHLLYDPPAVGFMVVGVLVFILGEVGNCLSHIHIVRAKEHRVVPLGGMFNYISRPHYLFEIMTWLGFALTTFTLPTLMFFMFNSTVLLTRGHQRHAKYREREMMRESSTKYCSTRKAIIPFLF